MSTAPIPVATARTSKPRLRRALRVRCGVCDGLRSVGARQARRTEPATCVECNKGCVIRREDFYDFWLGRFSLDEIRLMGQAIWGRPPDSGVT